MLAALVLTAGLGKRLDPLTRLVAKPAVPVAGRTLIERVLEWLRREGVSEAVLNLHHRPETITTVVGDGAHLGVRVRYSWERELLGSAGGPRRALPLFEQPTFVIVNGDTLCDVNLARLVETHERSRATVTLAVIRNPAPDRYNGIQADADARVRAFVPKGRAEGTWHFVGVQVVNASVFASLPDGLPAETVAGLYRERVGAGDDGIRIWPSDADFLDVGTPRDYWNAARRLAGAAESAGDRALVEPGAVVEPGARLTRSIVWSGARVGRDAELDNCVVAGPVTVPPGFRARESLLVPASVAHAADAARIAGGLAVFPL